MLNDYAVTVSCGSCGREIYILTAAPDLEYGLICRECQAAFDKEREG